VKYATILCLALILSLAARPVCCADKAPKAPKPKAAKKLAEETVDKAPEAPKPKAAKKLAEETVDKVVAIVDDPAYETAEKSERREEVRAILLDVFDMDAVSALSLAAYRKEFDPEQLEEFTEVFSRLLFDTYIGHIERYSGEEVRVDEPKTVASGKIVVPTEVLAKNGPVPIEYSMFVKDNNWRVYDVKIEGLSLIKNYRSQFREILIKKSPQELIERLQKKASQNEEKS
jgi:phospholipid transport system substrate-binding protein